jgi:hypothetical protein
MKDSHRRWSRLWVVPVLSIVLAITTGWAPSAAPMAHALKGPAGHLADDIAYPPSIQGSSAGPQGRVARPQRTPPVGAAAKSSTATPAAKPAAQTVSIQNHFWMPALGISRPVYWYSCARRRAPDNLVYRWGCAGTNNVYILGHAYGVMKPLHDAYVSGRLRVGMLATYADGNGNRRTYRVTTWRLVTATNAAWAEASQPVPSMTLQTCVGAQSQWRLVVRLVAVN